jgi:hypothetical protein
MAVLYGLLGAEAEQSLLSRLPHQQRVKVMAALAVVVLLGVTLILFAWWGARVVRRHYGRRLSTRRDAGERAFRQDDWATKPLVSEQDRPVASDRGARPDSEA